MAMLPARNTRVRAQCSYVEMQLQRIDRQHLASNKLARSAPKRVAVRVNRGLDRDVFDTQVSALPRLETMTEDSDSRLTRVNGGGPG